MELSVIQWFKTASATFAGGAVALGLLAIPTYIWLPREFDAVRQEIAGVKEAAEGSKSASEAAAAVSVRTQESVERLIVASAKAAAQPLIDEIPVGTQQLADGALFAFGAGSVFYSPTAVTTSELMNILPADLKISLREVGLLSDVIAADFDDSIWLFVDRNDLNKLTSQQQLDLTRSLEEASGRLIVSQ